MMRLGVIYQIRNTVNGKVYVGKTFNQKQRWSIHKSRLNKCTHENSYLQRSWNKYGADKFEFSTICTAPEACLTIQETYHIFVNDCKIPIGYNMVDPFEGGNRLGSKHSDESKAKMRLNNGKGMKGVRHSSETITQMSIAKKGKKFSEEHKDKLKQAWLVRKENYVHPFKGKKLSEAHKKALSESHKGQVAWNKRKG